MQAKKYGCFNRAPYKDTVEVQQGWEVSRESGKVSRTAVMIEMPFTMSRDCNYTHTRLGQQDPGCAGCTWKTTTPQDALSA